MTLVLDASMALAWLFVRVDSEEADRANAVLASLREQSAVVPALWHAEILNAIVVGQRRATIAPPKMADFVARLGRLPIETDDPVPSRREHIVSLALEHGLSGYDALYLELAMRLRVKLATFDRKLAAACAKVGVPTA
jgi:predicted nucleic acid-binding protein